MALLEMLAHLKVTKRKERPPSAKVNAAERSKDEPSSAHSAAAVVLGPW